MKSLRSSAIFVSGSALALCLALVPLTQAQQQQKAVTDTFGDKPAPDNTIQPTADHPTAQPPNQQADPAAATAKADTSTAAAKPETGSPAAQTEASTRMSAATTATTAEIEVAGKDAEDRTDRKIAGGKVEGSDGKDLGNIKDFLVDPASGRVEYAVITTGGVAGIGDKLRLVPLSELKPGEKENEFRLAIGKDRWDQIAPMADDAFKAEKITMTDAERHQVTGHFGSDAKPAAQASPYSAGLTSHLVRASDFHRKEVRAGGRDVGSIESLVIDMGKGTATALLDPKRDFTGSNQKYLVPLSQFAFSSAKEAAATNLTPDDLNRAAGNLISSSSTGSLPVAGTSTSEPSTSTSATVAQSSTSSTAPTAASDTTTSRTSSSTAPSPGTTTSDQSLTMTGRDSTQTVQAGTQTKTDQSNTAQASTSADRSSSTLATADQSNPAQAKTDQSNIAQADTQKTDQTAATAAEKATTSTSAQVDAQTVARTPPNRNEQGQDIATTTPASPSSNAPGADLAANSKSNVAVDQSVTADATQKSTSVAASSTPPRSATSDKSVNPDDNLTPTGQTSADQVPANADPALISAALGVRKALDENPSLARLDVSVTPENGKLTIRGSVATNQLKTSVEETAERAASGKEIDSQLTVENK